MKAKIILFFLCLVTINMMGQGVIKRQKQKTSVHTKRSSSRTVVKSRELKLILINEISTGKLEDGHYYVDLGLPSGTLWATCNIGALSPEENGNYYAWGETRTKEIYMPDTYKWSKDSGNKYAKYCSDAKFGTVDNKSQLDNNDDAAYVNWGNTWRMPTFEQIKELADSRYTKNIWALYKGKKGCLIISKKNGNSIFLPAAGEMMGSYTFTENSYGKYWTNSAGNYTDLACAIWFGHVLKLESGYLNERRCGLPIRPVVAYSEEMLEPLNYLE